MKNIALRLIALTLACSGFNLVSGQNHTVTVDSKYTLVDLNTGETIKVFYDTVSWRTINVATTQPVEYYIIRYDNTTIAADTVHGATGIIVNNLIWNKGGKWAFNDAKVKWDGSEFKMKDKYGRKVKWEKGELKIKDWNSKYKSSSADNEAKYK